MPSRKPPRLVEAPKDQNVGDAHTNAFAFNANPPR